MLQEKEKPSEEIRVVGLQKYFPIFGGIFKRRIGETRAVDHISFSIRRGETFGLVGESGSGKTTAGKTVVRLYEPTGGEIWFGGENIARLPRADLKRMRRMMQIVFQDPTSSLNPRMTVGDIVAEPLIIHKTGSRLERRKRVLEVLNVVQLAEDYTRRYPHELSGGEKQRVGIARALALNPVFLVLDEPTSSLDVSVQAKVISLLVDLQKRLGLTFLYISHDIVLVKNIADKVGVMYYGKIIEMAGTDKLFNNPFHPYTQTLLSAVPTIEEGVKLPHSGELEGVEGGVDITSMPVGCRFYPRCKLRMDICNVNTPEPKEVSKGHWVACHLQT
jgi:oligopeptide transport system ATP-binding protein